MKDSRRTRKAHWSQTPEGRAKLSRAQTARWKKVHRSEAKQVPTPVLVARVAVAGEGVFRDLHIMHEIVEKFEALSPLGRMFIQRALTGGKHGRKR